MSRSASRTFWKMTCLASCAAMRPSGRGVPVQPDLAAHFHAGRQFLGLLQRDLVHRILDLVVVGDDRLVDVGGNLAGLLVQLAAHVFLGLVELARSQGDGLLHRADHDRGFDALFPAQKLDTLIQSASHACSLVSDSVRPCGPCRLVSLRDGGQRGPPSPV